MKQWAIFGGLMLALHLGFALAFLVIAEQRIRDPAVIAAAVLVYLVLFAVIGWRFFRRLNVATYPEAYVHARARGVEATAKVLQIERTRWRHKRNRNFRMQMTPARWEYVMRVRVSRPGVPEYEAALAEFLEGADVPKQGATIPVRVHPEKPDVVVMARE